MPYVVIARWRAREGSEERVRAALGELLGPSRAEPGCLLYQPTVDLGDPQSFLLIEVYEDREAYEAHMESEHFQRHAVADAIPLLESRERELYETLGPLTST